MHILHALNYTHICLRILNDDIFVRVKSLLPELGLSVQKWILEACIHLNLQVMTIGTSNVFFWDWAYFCGNWVIRQERMRKRVVRRVEFSDSETQLGELAGRERSLRQVQSIPDNQLIIYTCLCCKNNCRSCNVGREKLPLVCACYLLPYTF